MFKKLKWMILLLLLSALESHATFSVPDRPVDIPSRSISSPTFRPTFAHFALFVVSSSSDPSGSLQGAGGVGGLVALVTADDTYVYCMDANGNVVQMLDASDGSVEAAYEYSPFGKLTSSSGAMADENPFRFSTKYWDIETGLGYWGMRYYHPEQGRWLSRDPLGEEGGVLLYGFVGNDPVGGVDLLGMAQGDLWDLRSYGTVHRELWQETKHVGIRLGSGIKEGALIGSDMWGYHWADCFGYGEFYEGRSKLYRAMAANPSQFGSPEELRGTILKGTAKEVCNIGTLGFYKMAESHGEAWATGDWSTAQDRSLQAVLLSIHAGNLANKGVNPYGVYSHKGFSSVLSAKAPQKLYSYSYAPKIKGPFRVGPSGRAWASRHAPGDWAFERGVENTLMRVLRTGRLKPFRSTITLEGEAAAQFKPVSGSVFRGWKGAGGQWMSGNVGSFSIQSGEKLSGPSLGQGIWFHLSNVTAPVLDFGAPGLVAPYEITGGFDE